MMNINRIKNSTLAKLTKNEIGDFGLCNYGVGLYKGTLKTRFNGIPRKTEDGVTFTFESTNYRVEFTAIVSEYETQEWAARIYDKQKAEYMTYPMGIIGCDYFRG